MSEAKPAAKVPHRTREERDPARDGASTGGTGPLAYFGITQKGRSRPNNEDSLLVGAGADRNLFAVADGMGGHRAGEVASFIATAVLGRLGSEDPLEGVIRRANRSIVAAQGDEELAGMGTTVVALRFSETQEGPVAEVAHVGDSRAYLLRDGRLRRLTEDHSLAAGLARGGATTPDRAAYRPRLNVLTRALGVGEEVGVESRTLGVREGDRFLLCSDGLSDAVADAEIARIAGGFLRDPEGAARELLAAARRAGSPDDATVVVVDATRAPRTAPARVASPRGTSGARFTVRGRSAPRSGSGARGTGFRKFGRGWRLLGAVRQALRGANVREPALPRGRTAVPAQRSATPGSTAEVEVSGGVRSRSHAL